MVIGRRSLLFAGVAVPVAARAQCVTDTPAVDACSGGVRITAPPGKTLDLSFLNPGVLDPSLTFTRGSTATYFDSSGTLQTVSGNTPRWDYDPVTYALRGLLIEEARTNVLLNTATLGTQSVAVTAQAYTLSFYGIGTITKSGTASGALVGAGAFPQRVSQTFTPTAGTLTLTVTGSVLNAQLEAGSFVTSWIPTTAAAVTRSRDAASMPVAAWFNATTGSLQAEFIVTGEPSASFSNIVGLVGADANNNFINLYRNSGDGSVTAYAKAGGSQTASVAGGITTYGQTYKAAFAYSTTQLFGALSGTVTSGALTGLPTVTALWLFNEQVTFQFTLSGYMRRVQYWPRVLSNTELQQVTR